MKKKRILPLVALLTVIGLTACAGEASSVSSTSDSSSQTSSVEPSTEDSSEISSSDEVSSEDSSTGEDSSSEDSSTGEDSSSEDSSTGEDSSSEDSSTGEDSSSEDSSSVEEIPVEGVSLDQTYAYAEIGGTVTLTATITPDNTTETYSVEWSSSDENVATVVGGVVTGVAAGKTTITATVGDYSATCTIYVKTAVTTIANLNAAKPSSGDYYRIQGYVYSSGGTSAYIYDGTAGILVYYWSNTSAVNDSALTDGNFVQGSYVDIYGKISLYSNYNYLIELVDDDTDATYAHTYTPASEITAPSAETVTEASQLASMVYSNVYTVTAKLVSGSGRYWVFNVDETQIEYVLNSYDPNYNTALTAFQGLTVGNIYNITAPSYGYSSSYGYCFQAFGDYVNIESVSSVSPTSITVAAESDTISIGSTTTVSVSTYSPWYADVSGVTWSSSDTSIATVSSDGTVTGVAAGSVTITGTIGDASAYVTITISADPITPESITVTIDNASIAIGGTATATAAVYPTAADQGVTWSSSDNSIASVDENGTITGVGVGTATITATSTFDGSSVYGSATIYVCNSVTLDLTNSSDLGVVTSYDTENILTFTSGNYTYGYFNSKANQGFLMMTKNAGYIYNTTAFPGTIRGINVTGTSGSSGSTYYLASFGSSAIDTFQSCTQSTASHVGQGNWSATNKNEGYGYFNISINNANGQIAGIEILFDGEPGTGDTDEDDDSGETEEGGETGGETGGDTGEGGETGGEETGGDTDEGGSTGGDTEEGEDTGEATTQSLTITADGFGGLASSYADYGDDENVTIDGVGMYGYQLAKNSNNAIQMRYNSSNQSCFYNTTALSGTIESITLTFDSAQTSTSNLLYVAFGTEMVSAPSSGTNVTYDGTNYTYTVTPEGDYSYFNVCHSKTNGAVYLESVVVNYTDEGGSTGGDETGGDTSGDTGDTGGDTGDTDEDEETGEDVTYDIPDNATAISTVSEFTSFFNGTGESCAKNAYLAADIDLTGTTFNTPAVAGEYSAIFEGCGHTVTYSGGALFNIITGTVRNINVVTTNWTTSGYGTLAYQVSGGTVDNVDVEVTISSSINSWGPVALFSAGTISNCDSTIHMAAEAATSNTLYGAARADEGSTFTNNTYHVDGEGYNSNSTPFTDVEGVTWRE